MPPLADDLFTTEGSHKISKQADLPGMPPLAVDLFTTEAIDNNPPYSKRGIAHPPMNRNSFPGHPLDCNKEQFLQCQQQDESLDDMRGEARVESEDPKYPNQKGDIVLQDKLP